VPTAKETKINELQIKVVDAFVDAITPTGENDLVNMVVVTDPKGMFLDLPREDKGFITKAEGGRNYMLMLSMLDGMLTKTK
jgi:hypothetical protein